MPAKSRLLVLTIMCVAPYARHVNAAPPIDTSGKIATSVRLIEPARGSDTESIVKTFELRGSSYIWEPWFGNWQASGTLTRSDTDSDRKTKADIFAGDLQVNLFHRSHFPFNFFATIQDSRVDITGLSDGDRDFRTLGVGINQQYQDRPNRIYYFAFLRHDEQQDLSNDSKSIIDRFLVNANMTGQVHSFTSEISAAKTQLDVADSDTETIQFSGSHTYRPRPDLTFTNNANALSVEGRSAANETSTNSFALGSQVDWQPDEGKLRVRGSVDLSRKEVTHTRAEDQTQDELEARASARYELSDRATISGRLGYDHLETSNQTTRTGFAGLSGTYRSEAIDWNKLKYTWRSSAGLNAERTQNDEEASDSFGQSASLGHEIGRTWIRNIGGPVPFVFSAGQEVQALNDPDEDSEIRLTHRATLSATRANPTGTSYGQLSMYDIRSFGRTETNVYSVFATASHNRRLSRYRTIDMTASYGYNGSEVSDASRQDDNLALELRYRDTRFFDVNRLEFESRIRATAEDLLATSSQNSQVDFEWDNRILYRIGLLEVDGRAELVESEQGQNFLYTLSLTRRF